MVVKIDKNSTKKRSVDFDNNLKKIMSDNDSQMSNQNDALVVVNRRKVSDYSESIRKKVIAFMIDNTVVVDNERNPIRGAYASAAKFFAERGFTINETTIRRLWLKAKENRVENGSYTATAKKKDDVDDQKNGT